MIKYIFLFLISVSYFKIAAQTVDSIAMNQVDSLILISRDLTAKNSYEQALEVNTVAEKIALEKLGRESAAFGRCANNRGRVNYFKGDYKEAEKWFFESKTINEKVLGKENNEYAKSVINLAFVYRNIRQFEKAESGFLEVISIRKKILGVEHPDYAFTLRSLADLYSDLGQFEKAEQLYLEVKAIQEKVLGKDHIDYASTLSNLAVLYTDLGQFDKAEQLYLEARVIKEKVLGKEHPSYAITITGLAILYMDLGQFEKAELYYLEAKDIKEKVFGKEHSEYALSLVNLAVLYWNMEKYEKAEPLYLESVPILAKELGSEDPEYAITLFNQANLYLMMGVYTKAEPLLLESRSILEKTVSKEHPLYASILVNLANLYYVTGQFEKSELLHLEAKSIREKVLGKEHPDYNDCLSNLAALYEKQGKFLDADHFIQEALTLTQATLVNVTRFLSEQEIAKYVAKFRYIIDNYNLNLCNRKASNAELGLLPSLGYDNSLFYKGFLLTAASRLNSPSLATSESEEINIRFKEYHRRLAAEYAKPVAERQGVAELEEKANLAEKELARSLIGYKDAVRQVNFKEVKARLKISEAAIEFVHFRVRTSQNTDSTIYAAFVVSPELEQPKFIPLFEEKALDSLLNSKSERKSDYVNSLYSLADRGAIAMDAPRKSLYEILWKSLDKELDGIKTIYFSPSGLLHRINLDAIPVSETETLADKYNLIELNSTRQMVIPNQVKIANNAAVLFGGIQYEQDTMFQNNEPIFASRSRGELSFNSVDSTLRGGTWNYLAGTEREVNSIEKIMQTAGIQTNIKKGYAATEESFKNIGSNKSSSPRILHIATHGYFFPDPKVQSKSNGLSGQNEPVFKISDHPMLRSGLIMAGGNATWQGKQTLEGREDGILTAYEISQMNLSNTELVVLSACETGLGDIQGNEGVYGLQRAFKIAGAKYLIMSLWQVPDKQTSLLMTTFYKKWLSEKMTIPDAFHAAQKELRDNGLDPYNWAGFVLVE